MAEGNDNGGHRERLRARFEKAGFHGFADYEVVELMLTLCIPRRDVKPQAKALLKRFGDLRGILDAEPARLREVQGIGNVAPTALRILKELMVLYLRQRAEGELVLDSPERLEEFWRARLGPLDHEVFEVGYLDKAFRLMKDGVERLQTGDADRSVVYPRQVVAAASRRSACAIVIAHNHPSGRLQPSVHDERLTSSLMYAAAGVGIRILDHLIVTGDDVFSFRRNGLLRQAEQSIRERFANFGGDKTG